MFPWSPNSEKRPVPATCSISLRARAWAAGKSVIARKKFFRPISVWKKTVSACTKLFSRREVHTVSAAATLVRVGQQRIPEVETGEKLTLVEAESAVVYSLNIFSDVGSSLVFDFLEIFYHVQDIARAPLVGRLLSREEPFSSYPSLCDMCPSHIPFVSGHPPS